MLQRDLTRITIGFRAFGWAMAMLVTTAASAVPSTLVESDFTGTAPGTNTPWTQTSTLDSTVQFSGWTRGGGAIGVGGIDDAFGFSVSAGSGPESTLAAAIADNEYVSCTITPTGGGSLNLSGAQVNLGFRRSSWWSPRQYAFFTSIGGFVDGQEVFVSAVVGNGDTNSNPVSFFLPTTGYGSITGSLEIRVYAHTARYGGHSTRIESFSLVTGIGTANLTLTAGPGGSAVAVPDTAVFTTGETAVLSATPDPGFRFAGWSGDLTGFGNPRGIVMDADKSVMGHFEALPAPHMVVGTNMNGVTDWTTSWVFKDVFNRARTWLTRNSDGSGAWSSGKSEAIPLDANWWPTQVPFDPGDGSPMQMVHSIIVSGNDAGPYTFFYNGSGTFRFRAEGSSWVSPQTDGTPRSVPLNLTRQQQITIEITASGPAPNHLRDFRIVPDAHLANYEAEPFHPLFLERLRRFDHLRFMDWGRTNGSPLASWADRTRPNHQTQARTQGVALEHMIEICNTLGCDAWFCIPHRADDDYVLQAATLIRDTLDPSLRAYVEYSNETWNGIFSQTGYVQDQGEALGLDPSRWTAGQKFVSLRSAQIWKSFEDVFGAEAPARLVKVIATQSSNISITHTRVAALNDPVTNPDQVFPDALAIAPYFGHNFTSAELPPNVAAYPAVDEIATTWSLDGIAEQRDRVRAQKTVADEQGWTLICYEGGQHYTGLNAAANDTTLTNILTSANRDPRMYRRYEEYLDMLMEEGVGVFSNFTFAGTWGRYGSWGILEELDQPIEDAPKFAAVTDWMDVNVVGIPVFGPTRLSVTGVDDLEVTFRSKPATRYRIDTSPDLEAWTPALLDFDSQGLQSTALLPSAASGTRLFVRLVELE